MAAPAPELRVYASNRLENLAERLASVLERPLSSPLRPETIVVPNLGTARWLALWLAERLGGIANFRFVFPDRLIGEAVRAVCPAAPDGAAFDPEVLGWRILKHLPALLDDPGAAELRGYLAADPSGVKGFQLARRLAETFELYSVFRPELLQAWEEGREEDWQAQLWRLLTRESPGAHKAALMSEFLRRAPGAALRAGSLPERVSVFGVASLAPLRLRVLTALSALIEVSLFVVNPASTYWGHILSEREVARERRRQAARGRAAEGLHLEVGHPLLASLGRLGRDFLDELLEAVGTDGEPDFQDPGEGSLLACLQSDILNLRERPPPGRSRTPIDPKDRSLQVHSCHGPLREVEVLHDHLLELFETLPGLRPGDVLVATPDIDAYAPFIAAVFEGEGDPGRRIPYSIADRSVRAGGRAIDAFLRLLALPESRFGATEVLDLLEAPDVLRRFGLNPGALDTARAWLEETRIRWGIDGADRGRRGLPPFEENSWRAGLRRLLLGYALPGDGRRLFGGLLPYPDVEGAEARTLGALTEFVEELAAAAAALGSPRPLGRWAADLARLLDRFLLPDAGSEAEVDRVRREVVRLAENARLAHFDAPVDLRAVRLHLRERMEATGAEGGFLAGKVTFCAMRPLRSVPFRVVALLGMNDGAFPRVSRPPTFDRMARAPRRGDPSLRDEDRYLFLEMLLAARERFYLSYTGQSVRDGSELQPSVLVSELLDALEQGFQAEGGALRDRLVTRHRLQAFSPAYFRGDPRLFSYSAENFEAVAARQANAKAYGPFVASPLPDPGPEARTVEVRRLADFFSHPSRFFLRERLGLRLAGDAFRVEDREPFEVAGLDRYGLQQDLVAAALEGRDPEEDQALLRARGLLPPGSLGEAAYRALRGRAEAFADRLRPYRAGGELPPLEVDVHLGGFRVMGRLRGVWPEGLLRHRPAAVKGRDRVRLWVEHLVLGCLAPAGYPERSLLFGTDAAFEYGRPENVRELLLDLLDLYVQGLREPLRFFPESSLAYAAKARDPEAVARALSAARSAWEGSDVPDGAGGEGDEPHHRLCFGRVDPLDQDFERLASQIADPLLDRQVSL